MRKKLLILVAGVATIIPGMAQRVAEKKGPTLAVSFGLTDFETARRIRATSLAEARWAPLSEMQPALMASFINGISPHFDYSVNATLASVKYPFRDRPFSRNEQLFGTVDASVHMKLLTDNYFFSPYLAAGVGASMYGNGFFEAQIPVGLGAQFKIAKRSFIFSNFRYHIPVTARANYYFLYTIGFGGFVGKEPEVKALPVVVPPPPSDRDKDGVIDDNDKCPDVPGLAKYQGCPIPDTDKDGVNDEEDKCPQVPGLAKYQGCPIPDTDKDGINDEQDKCPTTPGLERYQGCPIPDRDGDGINDEEDRCPDLAGIAENYGCPEFKYNSNVLFKVGSATLLAGGKSELDGLVDFMNKNDKLRIKLEGHTDNTGSEAFNLKLSQQRAEAAMKYVISKGIDASRLAAEGYGESQPVADNKTAEGRAQNRRVHAQVLKD